ncbi:hypothetical protein [Desulfosarcina sp.]|uniref:hypothetical protein n=1 Tax=Desulfosarcina sp. TaxID=2027861 RepID=UPI003970BE64
MNPAAAEAALAHQSGMGARAPPVDDMAKLKRKFALSRSLKIVFLNVKTDGWKNTPSAGSPLVQQLKKTVPASATQANKKCPPRTEAGISRLH